MTRIGTQYTTITRQDGRTILVVKKKRYDVSTELKRKKSKRVRTVRKGARP